MPKVRWLTSVAGDIERREGDITDETEEIAAAWADGDRAVRVDRERKPETMAARAPEVAAERTSRGRSR